MRVFALFLILFSDLIVFLTRHVGVNATGLTFLLTLLVVILLAFATSALLRGFKSVKMSRNYSISGVTGIILGLVFFFWINGKTRVLLEWFDQYGLLIVLLINLVAALYIFVVPKKKKVPRAVPE